MTDTPTRDETKIDTAALRARLSAVAHGSDRPYAASVAKDAFGALSILIDEIDRLRAEVERLRGALTEAHRGFAYFANRDPYLVHVERAQECMAAIDAVLASSRLRSKIASRDIPIRPLEDEK